MRGTRRKRTSTASASCCGSWRRGRTHTRGCLHSRYVHTNYLQPESPSLPWHNRGIRWMRDAGGLCRGHPEAATTDASLSDSLEQTCQRLLGRGPQHATIIRNHSPPPREAGHHSPAQIISRSLLFLFLFHYPSSPVRSRARAHFVPRGFASHQATILQRARRSVVAISPFRFLSA